MFQLLIIIIISIVSLFYVYISKYNVKEKYELKDTVENSITKIRGSYVDVTYNGENVHIFKDDNKEWHCKTSNGIKKLEYGVAFYIGDRGFEIICRKKRDGVFVLLPLLATVVTILWLAYQTSVLIEENAKQKNDSSITNIETVDPIDPDSASAKDENFDPMNERDELPVIEEEEMTDNLHTFVEENDEMVKENIEVDWESFQESEKQRRTLLNDSSEMGIQVSKYQEEVNWEEVKADGIDYAIIQAGSRGYETGSLYEDSRFKENISGAKANGIKVGVSFHSQAINRKEMDEEIELIMKSIKGYELEYPIGITLVQEENCRTSSLIYDDYVDLIKYFCIRIKQMGYTPMIMGEEAGWFAQFSERKDFNGYLKLVYEPNRPPVDLDNCIIWLYRKNSKNLVDGVKADLVLSIGVSAYVGENVH